MITTLKYDNHTSTPPGVSFASCFSEILDDCLLFRKSSHLPDDVRKVNFEVPQSPRPGRGQRLKTQKNYEKK